LLIVFLFFLFFFSSRRRHTRFSRDWSSDVCSSDLSLCLQWTVTALLFLRLASILSMAREIWRSTTALNGDSRNVATRTMVATSRSEERRVGKEGRSRGVTYHARKRIRETYGEARSK